MSGAAFAIRVMNHRVRSLFSLFFVFATVCGAPPRRDVPPKFVDAARQLTDSIQKFSALEESGLYAQSTEKREPELMWGNGVMFSALVAAARHDPQSYGPQVDRFFEAMNGYWDSKAKIPGYEPARTSGNGNDKYYDDNQWMVITFLEAHELLGDEKYLNRADETLAFPLSGWDDKLGGGIWWHEQHKDGSKNTCSNAPAAVACLLMARERDAEKNLDWAKSITKWTTEHPQDRDGRFLDNQKVADGKVDKRKYTYNAGLMLRAYLGLWRATGDRRFLTEAQKIGAACGALVDPKSNAYRDGYKFMHLLVEADLELYRATGGGAATARAKRNGEAAWKRWQADPPKETIEQAGIARMLWLLADHETEVGRAFWKKSDARSKPAK